MLLGPKNLTKRHNFFIFWGALFSFFIDYVNSGKGQCLSSIPIEVRTDDRILALTAKDRLAINPIFWLNTIKAMLGLNPIHGV